MILKKCLLDENQEIDLIVENAGEVVAICEIKSTEKVDERHASNLNLFGKDFPKAKKLLVSNDPQIKKFGEATALYWKDALDELQNLIS